MARSFFLQNNFTAGQVSPYMLMRTDFVRHKNGLAQLENMTVKPQGAVKSRPGFVHHATVKDSSKTTILIPFEVSETVSYIVEAGESYFRFIKDGAQVRLTAQDVTGITQANPAVVTYSGADNYANGDRVVLDGVVGMTQVNGVEYEVANVNTGANTFELSGIDSTGFDAYTSDGTVAEIYEITHTYAEDELEDLRYTQSADVMFIVHGDHPERQLARTADTSWAISDTGLIDGPYLTAPSDGVTLSTGGTGTTGTVTLTASSGIFAATDTSGTGGTGKTDRLIRIQTRSTRQAISDITQDSSGRVSYSGDNPSVGDTVYIADVVGMVEVNNKTFEISSVNTTDKRFRLKDTDTTGFTAYTSGGTFQLLRDKWVWAKITGYTSATVVEAEIQDDESLGSGGPLDLFRLGAWSTTTGYARVNTFHENRLISAGTSSQPDKVWASAVDGFNDHAPGTDDDLAWNFSLLSDKLDAIQWISSQRQLRVGTAGSEFIMTGGSGESSITPTSIDVKRDTSIGSTFTKALAIQNSTLFVQRPGRIMREFAYNFDVDSFVSPDISLAAEDITRPAIAQMVFQQDPDGVVWVRRSDGQLVGLTYLRDQDVVGWHKHPLGGTDAIVTHLAVIPSTNQDTLWAIVSRTVNGATVQTIESLGEEFFQQDISDAVFLDAAQSITAASPTDTVTGLNHLEGETVSILTDGGVHPTKVVTNGTITLESNYTKIHVGLPYTQRLKTLKIEPGTQLGSTQGSRSRVTSLIMRFFETVGAKFGTNNSPLKPLVFRKPSDLQDEGVPLFTGDKEVRPPGGYGDALEIEIVQDQPLPLTLLGYVAKVETSDAP